MRTWSLISRFHCHSVSEPMPPSWILRLLVGVIFKASSIEYHVAFYCFVLFVPSSNCFFSIQILKWTLCFTPRYNMVIQVRNTWQSTTYKIRKNWTPQNKSATRYVIKKIINYNCFLLSATTTATITTTATTSTAATSATTTTAAAARTESK